MRCGMGVPPMTENNGQDARSTLRAGLRPILPADFIILD